MPTPTDNHFRVAIVGAGPAGLGTALGLARRGVHPVVLIDRAGRLGGVPVNFVRKPGGVPTFVVWTRGRVMFGQQLIQRLVRKLDRTSTVRYLETQVLAVNRNQRRLTILNPAAGRHEVTADAIVLACGAREKSRAERGWIAGARPARVYHTMHLLNLLDRHECLPMHQPVIIGSDLIALSAAAKLRSAGADAALTIDQRGSRRARWPARLYFRRWCNPVWQPVTGPVEIQGDRAVEGVRISQGDRAACDGVVISGELTPNSELVVSAGLKVGMPERVPVADTSFGLSEPGWFAAGNILGGVLSGEQCYLNGLAVAKQIARYLTSGV
jgi:thioredoxin reductase